MEIAAHESQRTPDPPAGKAFTCDAAYYALLLAEAQAAGASVDDLRAATGLEAPCEIVGGRVADSAVAGLWDLLARARGPIFGFELAMRVQADEHGALALVRCASRAAPTLSEGYRRFAKNVRLINDDAIVVLDERSGALRRLAGERPLHPLAVQFTLTCCLRWGRAFSREAWTAKVLSLRQESPSPHLVERAAALIEAPIRFAGAADEMVLERGALDAPLDTGDAMLSRVLDGYADRLLADLPAPSMVAAARRAVIELLPTDPSVDAVADALGISVRTLQRRLADEGVDHSALLAETRRRVACHLLENTALPVRDIARMVGYADATAFARAFRRWFDLTPAEHRASTAAAHA